ncbi:MAG: hypothetical protein M3483_02500 [Gemmatimonadota bacterium]|jgi:hypothetical protein|nr:hypothetical protein [Gemmatimonadota bacterium]
MSRVFVDDGLLSWEAYASGGRFGVSEDPKIIFHCLSDPARRARFIVHGGDGEEAEERVHSLPEEALKELLLESRELE